MRKPIAIVAVTLVLVMSPVVRAETPEPVVLTDAQIAQIRTRCVDVQSVLARLRANDGLRRVNLGQQYETISARLMASLNSRIALNKLNGVELAKTSVDFNTELDAFRSEYRLYEEQMSSLIDMKCRNQPVAFYDAVNSARAKRQQVKESVTKLNALLEQYGSQFDAFSATVLEAAAKETSQ